MNTFFRNIYYSLFLKAKKWNFKDPDTVAKEYAGAGRGLLYGTGILLWLLVTDNLNADIESWALFILFFSIEVFYHFVLYSLKTHQEIESEYNKLHQRWKTFYSIISLTFTPLMLIPIIWLVYIIKDSYIPPI